MNLFWTSDRIPWTGDQPDARPLPTHSTTQHRKTRTYIPCLEWDSHPRSRCSSGRRLRL